VAQAHLCGSLNLESAEAVFRTVAEISGDTVSRIPDGETGARQDWIFAQVPRLAANLALERAPSLESEYRVMPAWKVKEGVTAEEVEFDLGYADEASVSYPLFRALKEERVIAPGLRFQVSLPTALALVFAFISAPDQRALLPRLEEAMRDEVARITALVPEDELAVQWDVAVEISQLERSISHGDVGREDILDALVRLGSFVPERVELGYHLCYGDAPPEPGAQGRHFKQPEDAALLVEVANAISAGVTRTIEWIHMPVPIDRSDAAYFRPLAGLRLHPETALFLGLVHYEDGLEGTQRRIDAAAEFVQGFGVATECGMGRRPRERVPELLQIQRDAVVPQAVPVG
jgi:hypothetical protein